jgi:predicted transcriptional regulator
VRKIYIYTSAPDAVICVDIDDELYRRLQETAKHMGTTPEKLLRTILEEWLTPYTPEEEQEVVKRLRELGYE